MIVSVFSRPIVASFIGIVTPRCPKQYSSRRFTKVCGLEICRLSIVPYHKICHSAEAILRDPSHVLHPRLRQRYEPIIRGRFDDSQEGLWLMFTSNPMQKKRVVRSWARRRLNQAVVEQLRIKGFDDRGRRIVPAPTGEKSPSPKRPGKSPGKVPPERLVGTVDIEVLNLSVEVDYREVQMQAGLLVEEVLEICGRHPSRAMSPTRRIYRNLLDR